MAESLAVAAQMTHQGSDISSGIRTAAWPTVMRDVTDSDVVS